VSNQLFSARNLDWTKDSGINKYKLITVIIPPSDGPNGQARAPHAAFAYSGLWGALAGLSAKGITVHEANLEENEITFSGFPWILRLRYIMENAININTAQNLWNSTNNTVGYNHMITSAWDNANGNPHPVTALETMLNYTAMFADNDPREQQATYVYSNGTVSQIGYPLPNALWRTNHGYDPIIRDHYTWNQSPTSWTQERYMFAYNTFMYYEQNNMLMNVNQALNLTAILGDKGQTSPFQCPNTTDGSNVLSVMFMPGDQVAYAAWEDNSGANWRPACCNTYIKIDFTKWFNS